MGSTILVFIAFAQYVWDSGSLKRAPLRASRGKIKRHDVFRVCCRILIAREAFFFQSLMRLQPYYLAWGLVFSTLIRWQTG